MKCLMCESFSFSHICSTCQSNLLKPSLYERKILNTPVYSFYKYDEIKELLHTKHTDLGFYIYSILAKNSLKLFAKNFTFTHTLYSIAVDDRVKSGYSHTALLNRSLESEYIRPFHAKLHASNDVTYSGKSREFRLLNPRGFRLKEFEPRDVILVDDIITTGQTLTQAISLLQASKKEVVFCLTLADVSNKDDL